MKPELLPIQVPHLKDPVPGKQGIRMIPAPLTRYQPHKPLLKFQKGLPKGQIPARFKVPPHHQAILKVWEDHTIIEGEK